MSETKTLQFTNNTSHKIERLYDGFTLKLPNHQTVVLPVPNSCVMDVINYLAQAHPAIEVTHVEEPRITPQTQAAITTANDVPQETESPPCSEAVEGAAEHGNTTNSEEASDKKRKK